MKKFFLLSCGVVSALLLVLSGCTTGAEQEITPTVVSDSGAISTGTNDGKYTTSIDIKTKEQLARKRIKEMDAIRYGDYMASKNNFREALDGYYLPLLSKLPGDIFLEKKIGFAYFRIKDWNNAYKHFTQVPLSEFPGDDRNVFFEALLYGEGQFVHADEFQKLNLTDNEKEYYTFIDNCHVSTDICMKNVLAYSGSEDRILSAKQELKNTYTISTEPGFGEFAVAAVFYEQKMYRLVQQITHDILQKKPQYHEVRKLYGFALYELGKYIEAKKALLTYLETNPEDPEVIIRLGEIFTEIGDFKTANLYLNNIIYSGYKDKTIIERRLAYNYAKIGDKEGMKKVLSYLVQEKDAKEDDFAVAISLAFSQGENTRAYSWASMAIEKYPQSKIVIPLYIQSLRKEYKSREAEDFIKKLPKDIQELPLVQLEKAIILYEKDDIVASKEIFQALVDFNPEQDTDFSLEAKIYLKQIQVKEDAAMYSDSNSTNSFWNF